MLIINEDGDYNINSQYWILRAMRLILVIDLIAFYLSLGKYKDFKN